MYEQFSNGHSFNGHNFNGQSFNGHSFNGQLFRDGIHRNVGEKRRASFWNRASVHASIIIVARIREVCNKIKEVWLVSFKGDPRGVAGHSSPIP